MLDLLWLVLDVLCSGLLDGLLDSIPKSQHPREIQRRRRERESTGAFLVGLTLGFMSGWAAPQRMIPARYFQGTSIVFVPVLLGAAMHYWGKWRTRHGKRGSAVATWYGGGVFGFGLAIGRLLVLA